ncbi:MAG: DUF401 family protein [Alphaproteobacteria bacterium]|uniref:DUF401 family protein n=1 Tax=Candidatus Nitrobium versatile TaxID=2884831 RepID=A0A953M1Z3_9BACT|nr:DUF401 family protein [Candidatus Nitrobium versatile]
MLDVLKILLVFAAILVLLRLKWNVGYVLAAASGLLAVLYAMPLSAVLSTLSSTVTDPTSVKLFFALTLIRMFEMILREKQVMARMTEASRTLLKRKKPVIVSMPLLIGMLPSLGGAYFSAPMVEESTRGLKMTPEEKGFINYWFRHPWECVLPLYPGILLASAITKIELRSFILANMVYALLIVTTGFLFSMRRLESRKAAAPPPQPATERRQEEGEEASLWKQGVSFLPVTLVLLLVIVLRVELQYALGLTLLLLFAYYRMGRKELFGIFRYGFARDVIVLIFGVMLFKFAMENSGAVLGLSRSFTEEGIPLLPVLVLLPFAGGLLTGHTLGFVGSSFPLLVSITGGAHLNQMTLAFASGFLGVLLSPVHLCLVLTREYFKADAWGIYKRVIPASCIIMAAAFIEYFLL